jgi:hypothetical protein
MTTLNVTRKPVTVIVQGRGLTGAQGDKGDPGTPAHALEIEYSADGNTWSTTYTAGDFYARFSTDGGSTWGAGLMFRGPQGPQGPAGEDGADGRTILSGTVDPTTEGVDGDFYLNTATSTLFGPKATTWPAGVSLIGLTGPASSVDENIPIFDGVAGNLLKDSGVKLSDKANVTDVTDGLALKADITYAEYLMLEGDPA